jgi:hypothetical protein
MAFCAHAASPLFPNFRTEATGKKLQIALLRADLGRVGRPVTAWVH